jgi:hypothetical protein
MLFRIFALHGVEGLKTYAHILLKCGEEYCEEENDFKELLEAVRNLDPSKIQIMARPKESTLLDLLPSFSIPRLPSLPFSQFIRRALENPEKDRHEKNQ